VLVSFALGITCLFYGYNCENVELRANHTDHCKGIHNDDSARALQAFGWIFSIPWIIAVIAAISAPFYFMWKAA